MSDEIENDNLGLNEINQRLNTRQRLSLMCLALANGKFRWASYYFWTSIPTVPGWVIAMNVGWLALALPYNIWQALH